MARRFREGEGGSRIGVERGRGRERGRERDKVGRRDKEGVHILTIVG